MVSLNINSAIREVQTISKLFNNEALDGVLPSIPNINKIGATIFIPLVGLILYCTMHGKTPRKANQIGIFALIGFIINLILIFENHYEIL